MGIRTEKAIKSLPMVPLRGAVAFPGNIFHFEAGRKKTIIALNQAMENGQTVFLLAQKDESAEDPLLPGDFYRTGVVARVLQLIRVSKDSVRVITECLYRAKITGIEQQDPYFLVQVAQRPVRRSADELQNQALIRMALERFSKYSEETGIAENDAFQQVRLSRDPNVVADYIAGNVTMEPHQAQQLLEQTSATARLEDLVAFLDGELELLRTEAEIEDKVKQNIDRNQREYYLREQMHVIADELGRGFSAGGIRQLPRGDQCAGNAAGIEGKAAQRMCKAGENAVRFARGDGGARISGYLHRAAVGQNDGGPYRSGAGAENSRSGSLRTEKGQRAHSGAAGRPQAESGYQGADPLPGRAARCGKNVDRAFGRKGDEPQICARFARRRTR